MSKPQPLYFLKAGRFTPPESTFGHIIYSPDEGELAREAGGTPFESWFHIIGALGKARWLSEEIWVSGKGVYYCVYPRRFPFFIGWSGPYHTEVT